MTCQSTVIPGQSRNRTASVVYLSTSVTAFDSTATVRRSRFLRWACRHGGLTISQAHQRQPVGDLTGPRSGQLHRAARRRVGDVERPVASSSHVRGSVSTTLGGLPRVCRGTRDALHGNERRHPDLDAGARRHRSQGPGRQPDRLGEFGPFGLGPRVSSGASPQPPPPRRGSSPDRHCGGQPYSRVSKWLSTAIIRPTRWLARCS